MRRLWLAATASLAVLAVVSDVQARDGIVGGGSSTVAPFFEAVAAEFAKARQVMPEYRATSTGTGLVAFCSGIGTQHPDIAGASREIKEAEAATCAEEGVNGAAEIKFGYDAAVISTEAEHAGDFQGLTSRHVWLAIAEQVPVNGVLMPNPYRNWNEIDPRFPAEAIVVVLAPESSGTDDVFDRQIVAPACESDPFIANLDEEAREVVCDSFREDDAVIRAESSGEIADILDEVHGVGVVSFAAVAVDRGDEDADDVALAIDGVEPTPATIADGSYKGGRGLYLYVKTVHLGQVPGLKDFVVEFVSEKAIGEDGYLVKLGLVALPPEERKAAQAAAAALAATN